MTAAPTEPSRRFHRRDAALLLIGLYLIAAQIHVWYANRAAGYALPTPNGRKLRIAAPEAIRRAADRNTRTLENELRHATTDSDRAAIRRELDEITEHTRRRLSESGAGSRLYATVLIHAPFMVIGALACLVICGAGARNPENITRPGFLVATAAALPAAATAFYQACSLEFLRVLLD